MTAWSGNLSGFIENFKQKTHGKRKREILFREKASSRNYEGSGKNKPLNDKIIEIKIKIDEFIDFKIDKN